MLRQAIPGFENVMHNEEPKNSVIIVEGPPGSLKSSFVFTALNNYTKETNTKGLYLTLEESKERHIINLKNMGFAIEKGGLVRFIDYKYSRKIAKLQGSIEGELKWIIDSIKEYNKEHGEEFSCLVIDSLNVLYTMAETLNKRSEIYFFFEELRKLDGTVFIIAETSEYPGMRSNGSLTGVEPFLSDGLIDLGMMEIDGKVGRYVQIKKMRGVKHSLNKYSINISEGIGVVVLEELII